MARLSVFESYSRADESLAAHIAGDLGEIGLDVWRDQRLSGGQEWWDTILQSIRSADVFLFVVSDNSLDSVPCTRELEYAEALGKRVLPVRVDRGTSPKVAPPVLASKEWVDYDAGDRKSVLRLMRAVNDISPAGPLPDPLPAEPDVPLSYTTNLAALVHQAEDLTPAEQHSLLFQLREGLGNMADREECQILLARLRTRRELLASVAVEIDRALEDSARPQAGTTGPTSHEANGERASRGSVSAEEEKQSASGAPPPRAAASTPGASQWASPSEAASGWAAGSPQTIAASKKSGSAGRAMAIVGGVLSVIAAVVLGVVLIGGGSSDAQAEDSNVPNGPVNPNPEPTPETEPEPVPEPEPEPTPEPEPEPAPEPEPGVDLDALYANCADGSFVDCDSLYWESESGSEYEAFGASCGDRGAAGAGSCAELPFPYTYGDDESLDVLSDACAGEDWAACDDLYFGSESGSQYEAWGATCGGRVDPVNGYCAETLA